LDNAAETPNLGIVQDLVDMSDGSLHVRAGQEGEGRFSAQIALRIAGGIPVLVVDDNLDTLRLLERYLAHSRYRFYGTAQPEKVMELVDQVQPRAIILDVMLPGIDGWELFGRLREHPKTQDVPVIVCTILPQEELAIMLGAAEFVQKPTNRKALLTALDRLIKEQGLTPR
jgi:DNA-binding response OmpR family regulator